MSWADYGSVPVCHVQIVAVAQAVAEGSVADSLFTLLQLFEQSEVSRDSVRLEYLWPLSDLLVKTGKG
jgi:hypothetical protein